MSVTEYGIYLELDALFDTRLGVVDIIDPKIAEQLVNHPDYVKRVCDDFSLIIPEWDNARYQQAYKERDTRVLKHSRLSNAIYLLKHDIDISFRELAKTPWIERVVIYLNVHPYRLTDVEKEHIYICLRDIIGYGVGLVIVDQDYKTLSYDYIEKHYSAMILYNLLEWISVNSDNLDKVKRAHQVTLQTPLLFADKESIPTEQYVYVNGEEKLTAVEIIERFIGQFIGINLIDVEMFSVVEIQPPNQDEPA